MWNREVVSKKDISKDDSAITYNKNRYEVYGHCPECGALKLLDWEFMRPITTCGAECRFFPTTSHTPTSHPATNPTGGLING